MRTYCKEKEHIQPCSCTGPDDNTLKELAAINQDVWNAGFQEGMKLKTAFETSIYRAATRYERCCGVYQDGLGGFHCHDCGQRTFAMLHEVQTILGIDHKSCLLITDKEHENIRQKALTQIEIKKELLDMLEQCYAVLDPSKSLAQTVISVIAKAHKEVA